MGECIAMDNKAPKRGNSGVRVRPVFKDINVHLNNISNGKHFVFVFSRLPFHRAWAWTCNCHKKAECPLRGKCQFENVIYTTYKATVNSKRGEVSYIGLASGMFKKRYYNHTKAFDNIEYITDTELSKYIWALKKKEIKFTIITWELM